MRKNVHCLFLAMQGHSLAVSRSTEHILVYDPAIMRLGIYPDELKLCTHKKPAHGCFQNSFIYNCPNVQAAKSTTTFSWYDKNAHWHLRRVEDSPGAKAYELSGHRRQGAENLKYTLQDQMNDANEKWRGGGEPPNVSYDLNCVAFWSRQERKEEWRQTDICYDTDAPWRHYSNRNMPVTKTKLCDCLLVRHV